MLHLTMTPPSVSLPNLFQLTKCIKKDTIEGRETYCTCLKGKNEMIGKVHVKRNY